MKSQAPNVKKHTPNVGTTNVKKTPVKSQAPNVKRHTPNVETTNVKTKGEKTAPNVKRPASSVKKYRDTTYRKVLASEVKKLLQM